MSTWTSVFHIDPKKSTFFFEMDSHALGAGPDLRGGHAPWLNISEPWALAIVPREAPIVQVHRVVSVVRIANPKTLGRLVGSHIVESSERKSLESSAVEESHRENRRVSV